MAQARWFAACYGRGRGGFLLPHGLGFRDGDLFF